MMRAGHHAAAHAGAPLAGHPPRSAAAIGALATRCLALEVATWPKPGLVSHVDRGSHDDMDAALLLRSAEALQPSFSALAGAGTDGMGRLRAIGRAAEAVMLAETQGVNTHRGAIFGLGLLCAAAGLRHAAAGLNAPALHSGLTLGAIVRLRWGGAIADGPVPAHSHGSAAARRFGVVGARGEAAAGFPAVYGTGLPALRDGQRLSGDAEAARVQAIFALIAHVDDTNLLHRGGRDGLAFARGAAARFIDAGGVGADGWRERAAAVHAGFVARRLSPGGSADLLAMTLFAAALDDDA